MRKTASIMSARWAAGLILAAGASLRTSAGVPGHCSTQCPDTERPTRCRTVARLPVPGLQVPAASGFSACGRRRWR